jgi:hypothetical protein
MTECPRESEVFEAVAFNREGDVRDHLATCAICAEIADVAGALRAYHAAACREAPVPSAGAVWWRATVRARAEAAHTVSQPITVLQGIAGACGVGLAAALFAWRAAKARDGKEAKYRTEKVDRGNVTMTVTATGSLSAVTTVQVGSQVSGVIAQLYADFNSHVKKGQLLAVIVPDELRADTAYYAHNVEGLSSQVRESAAALRYQERQTTDQIRQAESTLASAMTFRFRPNSKLKFPLLSV